MSSTIDVNEAMQQAIEQNCETAVQALIGSTDFDFNAAIVYALEQDCKTAIQTLIESASVTLNADMRRKIQALEKSDRTALATALSDWSHLPTNPIFFPLPRGRGKKLCITWKLLKKTDTIKVSGYYGHKITRLQYGR